MRELLELLDRAEAIAPQPLLRELLEGDQAAEAEGFSLALAAQSHEGLERLSASLQHIEGLPALAALEPFQKMVEWDEETVLIVERSLAVVILAPAKRIGSRHVADLLGRAKAAGVPVLVLAEDMGRAERPEEFAPQLTKDVFTLLGNHPFRLVCLGDARYEGPSLAATLAANLASLIQAARPGKTRTLFGLRRRLVEGALVALRESAQRELANQREAYGQVQDFARSAAVLGRSETESWTQQLQPYATALGALTGEAFIDEQDLEDDQEDQPAKQKPSRARASLKNLQAHLAEVLPEARVTVEAGLKERMKSLLQSLDQDLSRHVYPILQDALPEDADKLKRQAAWDKASLDAMVKITLDQLEQRLLAAARPDLGNLPLLETMADIFTGRPAEKQAEDGTADAAPKESKKAEAKQGETQRTETLQQAASMLLSRPGRAAMASRVVARQIEDILERTLLNLNEELHQQQERARTDWRGGVEEYVITRYTPITQAMAARREQLQRRLADSAALLESLHV